LKRVLIILSFILLLLQSIKARNEFSPKTYLGIIQGVNFSRVDFDITGIEQEFLPGYSGGLIFRYVSEPVAGIQIELNYTEKGWSATFDTSAYYKGRLSYIEMPLLTHITLGKNKAFFTINFGPYGSYQIRNNIRRNTDFPAEPDNKFEFGYCAGIGLGLRFSIGTFHIEGRYLNSLTNFFNKETNPQFGASRNQAINICLSYLIKLK
jgi:hypothetical protein